LVGKRGSFQAMDWSNLVGNKTRDVCSAVWFGFEDKSHSNREIKKHAVWFSSIDFKNKIQTKPMRFELDRLVQFFRDDTIFCFQH